MDGLRQQGHSLDGKSLSELRDDLVLLDQVTKPSASVGDLSEYAIRCATDANSLSSRRWRIQFMRTILSGTYGNIPPDDDGKKLFYRIRRDVVFADSDMCPVVLDDCAVCGRELDPQSRPLLAWAPGTTNFQLMNACWIHSDPLPPPEDGWVVFGKEAQDEERRLPLQG